MLFPSLKIRKRGERVFAKTCNAWTTPNPSQSPIRPPTLKIILMEISNRYLHRYEIKPRVEQITSAKNALKLVSTKSVVETCTLWKNSMSMPVVFAETSSEIRWVAVWVVRQNRVAKKTSHQLWRVKVVKLLKLLEISQKTLSICFRGALLIFATLMQGGGQKVAEPTNIWVTTLRYSSNRPANFSSENSFVFYLFRSLLLLSRSPYCRSAILELCSGNVLPRSSLLPDHHIPQNFGILGLDNFCILWICLPPHRLPPVFSQYNSTKSYALVV